MNVQAKVCDQLIEARWVIPGEPLGCVLEDHAVVTDGGRIVEILPITDARNRYAPREHRVLDEHALIPGLINCHTHAAMSLMRGLADDLPLMTWLSEHIWPVEGQVVGPEFVADGVELALAEMLLGGTTCLNDNYFFPDVASSVVRRMGMRACIGLPVIDFPTAWARTHDEYFDKGLELHDGLRGSDLIRTAWAPHAPYTVNDDGLRRVRMLADQLDIRVHMHVHETAQEIEDSKRLHGVRPLARLAGLDLVNSSLIAVHMTQLTDAEIEQLAAVGSSVVHCPESNLKLASGFCPVDRLQKAGVTLALGTDGCASNNDLDMFGEMRTAALLAKGVSGDASALSAPLALRAATLGGATAIGIADQVGTLEAGKQADMTAVRLDAIDLLPVFNPISHLVYACDRRQVTHVFVAGQARVADGKLVDVDTDSLRARARRWGLRIAALGARK